MTKAELLQNIELMRAEVEWCYPIDYAATLDVCEELVKEHIPDEPDFDCAMRDGKCQH